MIWGDNKKLAIVVCLALVYGCKFMEKHLKPARPSNAPTPLKLVEENRILKLFLAASLFVTVIAFFYSIAICYCSSVLFQFRWLLVSLVLVPVIVTIVYSEIMFYKALER